jgi:hypothetical protein
MKASIGRYRDLAGRMARIGKARDDAQYACRVQTGQPAAPLQLRVAPAIKKAARRRPGFGAMGASSAHRHQNVWLTPNS